MSTKVTFGASTAYHLARGRCLPPILMHTRLIKTLRTQYFLHLYIHVRLVQRARRSSLRKQAKASLFFEKLQVRVIDKQFLISLPRNFIITCTILVTVKRSPSSSTRLRSSRVLKGSSNPMLLLKRLAMESLANQMESSLYLGFVRASNNYCITFFKQCLLTYLSLVVVMLVCDFVTMFFRRVRPL